MNNKVLIIDDEQIVCEIIKDNLTPFGYDVFTAENAAEGIPLAQRLMPSVILLDVMLPDSRGWDICRNMRNTPQLKESIIIIMSSVSDTNSIVAAIEFYHADDYIVKPFNPRLLASKIKAFIRLRQRYGATKQEIITFGPLHIDKTSHFAQINGTNINLTKSEFAILYLLASNPNRALSRNEIIHNLKGSNYSIVEKAVDVQISALRKKLGKHSQFITTIRGVGFKFSTDTSF